MTCKYQVWRGDKIKKGREKERRIIIIKIDKHHTFISLSQQIKFTMFDWLLPMNTCKFLIAYKSITLNKIAYNQALQGTRSYRIWKHRISGTDARIAEQGARQFKSHVITDNSKSKKLMVLQQKRQSKMISAL